MEQNVHVVGIVVDQRASRAPDVQQVLTRYGSRIISRSGVPDPGRERGIITLTVQAGDDECRQLEQDLQQISGVVAKSINLGPAMTPGCR